MLVDLLCFVTRYVIVVGVVATAAWDYIGFGCHWYLSYTFKFIGVITLSNSQYLRPRCGEWVIAQASTFGSKWNIKKYDAISFDTTEMCKSIEGWSLDINKLDTCREYIDDRQSKKFFFLCIKDILRDVTKEATTTTMWTKLESLYTTKSLTYR